MILVPSVSKAHIATLDQTADTSQLRWVGTEFIYFLDIPWDYELQDKLSELANSHAELEEEGPQAEHIDVGSSSIELSTRSITIGLLENVMDMKIPEECLLSHDPSGQRVLSADHLSRLVVPWARNLLDRDVHLSDPGSLKLQQGKYNRHLLKEVTTALDHAVYSKTGSLVDDGPDSDMLCAVAIMLTSLERCIQAIWQTGDAEEIVDRTRMFGEVTQILRRKFSARWGHQASFEMEHLFSGGIPFAAYAIAYQPTANKVSNVDTKNYKPKHVTSACTCAFVKPPLSTICEFVYKKEVPVVVFDGTNLLVHSASDTPYVAISHVWADGLGSVTEEGLPRCQTERLGRLASELVPSGAFWQDGLCIPEEKEHRNLAIALMTETYADADKVLVLDEGLRTACWLSTPKEECLLRIATSGWMQRIWTLQEGMLGHELHFELMDGVIDCTHFNDFSFTIAQRVFPLLQYRRGNASTLTYKRRLDSRPRCTVNDLIALLRYRITSKSRDEPVAISGLLGVETGTLVHLESGEDQMKALLIEARELPRQLAVFGWYCLRLSLLNFGWAPISLSEVLWPGDPDDPLKAICTEDGLFGDFTVVRFPEVSFPEIIGIILIVTEQGQSGDDPRVFNLVLSPFFFRVPQDHFITISGFLLKGTALEESMREEGVGAVAFPPDARHVPHPVDQCPTLTCKFVAPASVRFGLPDKVETSRTRWAWKVVHATVEPLRKVRLT